MKGRAGAIATLLLLTALPVLLPGPTPAQATDLGLEAYHIPENKSFAVSDMVWSDDFQLAIAALGRGGVQLWEPDVDPAKARALRRTIPLGSGVVAVEAVGRRLLACDSLGTLNQLSNTNLDRLWSVQALDGTPRAMKADPQGTQLGIVGRDQEGAAKCAVLDLFTMEISPGWTGTLPGDLAEENPSALAWIPSLQLSPYLDRSMAIGTLEGGIYAYHGSGTAFRISTLGDAIVDLEWSEDGQLLYAATREGIVASIDLHNNYTVNRWHTSVVSSEQTLTAFDLHGDRFAVGTSSNVVEVWSSRRVERLQMIRHHAFSIGAVVWVNESHLISCNEWGKCVLWGPDLDGDGMGDLADAFPDDPTEWMDSDGDGWGNNIDAFPDDPTEWMDKDGDGWGDNSDVFPGDPTEWKDTDGDGIGDNGDFIPEIHNAHASAFVVVMAVLLAVLPVVRVAQARRERYRQRRSAILEWVEGLGLRPRPVPGSELDRGLVHHLSDALDVRDRTEPEALAKAVESLEVAIINLEVGLNVQEEIVERSGVGAEAALARSVQLREQLQELDLERETLRRIEDAYEGVRGELDGVLRGQWPKVEKVGPRLKPLGERLDRLGNSLERFQASSLIERAEHDAKEARGAYVVPTQELRVRGSDRVVGARRTEVPDGLEEPEVLEAPVDLEPVRARLGARQALLVLSETAELAVTVDNTLPLEITDLAVEFGIEGDGLHHKGGFRRELGSLVTGRSATTTFQMYIDPEAVAEPQHVTRVRGVVTARVADEEVRQELPAKSTALVTSTITPGDVGLRPPSGGSMGRRGVVFPGIPGAFLRKALEFPSGLLPLIGAEHRSGEIWHLYSGRTGDLGAVTVGVVIVPDPDATELMVEVRGPEGFDVRSLAEEVVDSVRYAVLVDRRIRLRGEDRPMPPERIEALGRLLAETYMGYHSSSSPDGTAEGGGA